METSTVPVSAALLEALLAADQPFTVTHALPALPTDDDWETLNGFAMKSLQERMQEEIEAYASPLAVPGYLLIPPMAPVFVHALMSDTPLPAEVPIEFDDRLAGRPSVTRGRRGRGRGECATTRGRV